ncbi:MAG TPA: wax ester/triacylglycerol synthase domain-containing protein [Acidimicrobiia bacterium]|nr:wax ester/triacylglycerol synthase domain-containing protein [Acidimicrobiia bacterium]
MAAARMNDAEAIMWVVESDPFLRTDFTNITLLESAPDPERLRAGLERAIDSFPPLRQRVARPALGLAPPQWADDPDFDLAYHLRRLSVPAPGDVRQLLDLAAQLAAMPLDRARPLWELTVVEGLAGGRAAVLQRLHHTLTDGVGGMRLLRSLLERTPPEGHRARFAPIPAPDPLIWRHPEILSPADVDPRPFAGWHGPAEHRAERDSPWGLVDRVATPLGEVGGSLAYRFSQGLTAARKGFDLATTLPTSTGDDLRILADRARRTARSVADQVVVSGGPLSPLMVGRSLARRFETDSFDLGAVRQAARAFGASRNAVFVAGVTGGLLTYHERMGAPCDALRMAIPVSLRGNAGPPPGGRGGSPRQGRREPAGEGPTVAAPVGGNRFAPARVVVPIGPKDPAKRIAAVSQTLTSVAAEPGLHWAEGLAGLISLLPASLLVPALRAQARTVDFAASIVPGLRSGRFMAGAPVEASWPMGPRVGCAVNFTLLTCDDRVHLGVNLDPAAVTDPAALMECLADSFGDLLEAGA